MDIKRIDIPGVVIIQPKVWHDERGYFLETFKSQQYREFGIREEFVQDNLSRSTQHVLRGLHYQLEKPQGKLVSVIQGKVLDVMLDIRQGSPTFGQHFSIVLDSEIHNQVYVPPGLAHGFCVLSEQAIFAYKCTDVYNPGDEYGILWNDPQLAIDWQLSGDAILSEKDTLNPILGETNPTILPIYEG